MEALHPGKLLESISLRNVNETLVFSRFFFQKCCKLDPLELTHCNMQKVIAKKFCSGLQSKSNCANHQKPLKITQK